MVVSEDMPSRHDELVHPVVPAGDMRYLIALSQRGLGFFRPCFVEQLRDVAGRRIQPQQLVDLHDRMAVSWESSGREEQQDCATENQIRFRTEDIRGPLRPAIRRASLFEAQRA